MAYDGGSCERVLRAWRDCGHKPADEGEMMYWIISFLSLVGVVLNIKKRKECFIIWTVTNFSWMLVNYHHEIYAQSALFAVYFLLALWGLWEWRKGK